MPKHPSAVTGDVPEQSPCCGSPILPERGRLYCFGCRRSVVDLRGDRRAAGLAELRWGRLFGDSLDLMWRNLRVAYARDVPEYGADWTVERVTYKWVVGCSNADFGRIATALDLTPDLPYPGRWGFPTLEAAAEDLWACLIVTAAGGPVPHWSAADRPA